MTTNPQIERMAIAINLQLPPDIQITNDVAKAAYDASDARFVPMLVDALKEIAEESDCGEEPTINELCCISIAKEALAQLPEGYK